MQIFARMMKVDEAARTVTGVIANEAVDRSGEVFDYATSKPHFAAWSGDIHKATGGKSVGNVRAMHGNVCAGKLTDLTMDDVNKAISVTAHIVDDAEWKKVAAGCYTGFSIGGSYMKKWDADGVKRYTAKPAEVSIVDLPCNQDATFAVIKADGSEEMRKFVTVKKSMWTVSDLAAILQQLAWTQDDAEFEASCEGDGSTIPAELKAAVKTLGDILVRMTAEEAAELTADDSMELAAKAGELQKREDDKMNDELQKSFDTAIADLAKLAGERDLLQKSLDTAVADLAKRDAQIAEQEDLLTKAAARLESDAAVIAANNEAIAKLKALPQPIRAAMHAVTKGEDVPTEAPQIERVFEADGVTVNKVATALRHSLQNPEFRIG